MKHRIKKISLSGILMLALMLCACTGQSPNTEQSPCVHINSQTVYAHGLELIDLISEMAGSEAYLKAATNSADIINRAASFTTGDRSKPLAVYEISWNREVIANAISQSMSQTEWNSMSDELRTFLISRSKGTMISQVNAQSGAHTLAAASLCTASKSFFSDELTEDVLYLYTYTDAVPVAVTFIVGEHGQIGASATFIMNDKLNYSSAEGIESFFNAGMDFVKVEVLNFGETAQST